MRTIHHMIRIFDTHVWNDDITSKFFSFLKSSFLRFVGDKRTKSDLKIPISVCFALHFRNCRSYHQDLIILNTGVLKKRNNINIKVILFLLTHFNNFFKIIICFSSSSINAKYKFWGVSHLHICVIFLVTLCFVVIVQPCMKWIPIIIVKKNVFPLISASGN